MEFLATFCTASCYAQRKIQILNIFKYIYYYAERWLIGIKFDISN